MRLKTIKEALSTEEWHKHQMANKAAKQQRADKRKEEIDNVDLPETEIPGILREIERKKYPVLQNIDICRKLQKMGLIRAPKTIERQSSFGFPYYLTDKGKKLIATNEAYVDPKQMEDGTFEREMWRIGRHRGALNITDPKDRARLIQDIKDELQYFTRVKSGKSKPHNGAGTRKFYPKVTEEYLREVLKKLEAYKD